MSTLCCAVVVGGGDALSPMRIRVPAAKPDLLLSGDDEAATTPEACTDEDSSFDDSDEDGSSSGSGSRKSSPSSPSRGWQGCNNSGKEKQLQRAQNPQPLRKVRFTLHDNDQHNRRVSGAMYRNRRRAAIRDSALADVGMMRPADLAQQQQQQGARPCFSNAPNTQRINKTVATISKSAASTNNDSGRRTWKKRIIAAAPFKSTSTNIATATATASSTSASPHYSRILSTPASPRKRKVSALLSSSSSSSSSSSRTRGGSSSSSSSSRPSRGIAAAAAAAAAVQGAAATASELKAASAVAAAKIAQATAAGPMDLSCEEQEQEGEEELDLTCKEELDMSCEGDMRTPICRFLLPSWPEGVEGYEEAGGWRRLGGSHTRENFPRGRRGI